MRTPDKILETRTNIEVAATDKDSALLQFHETGLQENAESMFAFASHLYSIKSKKLWEKCGCTSFKNYCEDRVPTLIKPVFNLSRLYQLAEWAEVKDGLPENVSTIVETEGQSRALAKAPKKERAKIVKAVAAEGKVTAKAITEKIAETKKAEPVDAEFDTLDKTGFTIPNRILKAWQHAEAEGAVIVEIFSKAKKLMEEKIQNDPAWIELTNNENTRVRGMLSDVKRVLPYAVCPTCEGKGCKHCKDRGYFSKYLWDMVPKEQRKGRK